jgi:hypothetical protein
VQPEGVITGWGFGPASSKDQGLAEPFFAARQAVGRGDAPCATDPDRPGVGRVCLESVGRPAPRVYLADKGFAGHYTHRRWRQRYGAEVVAPHCTTFASGSISNSDAPALPLPIWSIGSHHELTPSVEVSAGRREGARMLSLEAWLGRVAVGGILLGVVLGLLPTGSMEAGSLPLPGPMVGWWLGSVVPLGWVGGGVLVREQRFAARLGGALLLPLIATFVALIILSVRYPPPYG